MGAKNRGVCGVVVAQCWYVVQQREGGLELCEAVWSDDLWWCAGAHHQGAAAPLLSTTQVAVEMLLRYSYINMWEGVGGGARARSTAPAPAAADVGSQPRERWPRRARAACGVVGEW